MRFKEKFNKKKIIAMIIGIIAISKIGYEAFDKTSMAIDLINIKLKQKAIEEEQQFEEQSQPQNDTYEDDSSRYVLVGDGVSNIDEIYKQDFIIKDNNLYITPDKGKTWLRIPDNVEPGSSNIKDYLNEITTDNIYISKEEITIVYGGRGSDNITIINGDIQGNIWNVDTLGLTATRDENKGYDKMYIDFVDSGQTGYLVITKENQKLVYRSVNSGVTWDDGLEYTEEYDLIISHFDI